MSRILIPEYPRQRVQDEANRCRRGDDEKIPTTPLKFFNYRGVKLLSRYQKAQDYREMVRLLDALHDGAREMVEEVFCDTQACACYTVKLRPQYPKDLALLFVMEIEEAAKSTSGHNGIQVEWRSQSFWINPDWFETFD
jgi:hypothetical protein